MYASDHALQNHIKLKHKAGKKSEREKYAEEVFNYLRSNKGNLGESIPKTSLNIPESFIPVIQFVLILLRALPKSTTVFPK